MRARESEREWEIKVLIVPHITPPSKALMAVFTYETENTSVIPPAKLFKAIALDPENLIPKIAPLAITSTDIIEGNGQLPINFGEGKIQY